MHMHWPFHPFDSKGKLADQTVSDNNNKDELAWPGKLLLPCYKGVAITICLDNLPFTCGLTDWTNI